LPSESQWPDLRTWMTPEIPDSSCRSGHVWFRDARWRSRIPCRIEPEWPMTASISLPGIHHVPGWETGRIRRQGCQHRSPGKISTVRPGVAGEFLEIAAKRASPLTRWRWVSVNFAR
jgi:hypothetical protein